MNSSAAMCRKMYFFPLDRFFFISKQSIRLLMKHGGSIDRIWRMFSTGLEQQFVCFV